MTQRTQGILRLLPAVALMGIAVAGGVLTLMHRGPADSVIDGRALAGFERPSPGAVLDNSWMASFDTAMDDRFPGRARLLEAHANFQSTVLRSPVIGGVYTAAPSGQLLEDPPALDIRDTLAQEASGLQETVGDVPILWVYAPRKEEVYSDELPQAWDSDYPRAKAAILDAWSQSGEVLDLTAQVEAHRDANDAYFRTDHHWTPQVAREAVDAVAIALDSEGVTIGKDERSYSTTVGPQPFFGSTGRQVTAGATAPEPFAYPVPAGGFAATMCIAEDCGLPTLDPVPIESPSRYANRYAAFIGGDNGLVTITNDSPRASARVLLIKDSFGNAFATYLAERVSRLDVVDARHYDGVPLDLLVEESQPDVVIVLHNALSLLSDSYDPSVWTLRAGVETVDPGPVGDTLIATERGLLLRTGLEQDMYPGLTDDARVLADTIDELGVPQFWYMAPTKEQAFAELLPTDAREQFESNAAGVLDALRSAHPVTDLSAELSQPESREENFFFTDHHWTVTGANVAQAQILADLRSANVPIGEDDREWRPSVGPLPFYGSEARSLPETATVIPDQIHYEVPDGGFRATLCADGECGLPIIDQYWLDNPQRLTNRYRVFLGGTTGLMHLHNDSDSAAGTVVLLTDSYGTPVAARLAESARDVYLVDERKWEGGPLGEFIGSVEPDAVVMLHNPVTLLSQVFIKNGVWASAAG